MGAELTRYRGEQLIKEIRNTNLNISNFKIEGGQGPGSVSINYYADNKLVPAVGQMFVSVPEKISRRLPDTYVAPGEFIKEMLGDSHDGEEIRVKRSLLGDHVCPNGDRSDHAFIFEENGFKLDVFHGLTNPDSLDLTEIAHQGFKTDANRVKYQESVARIMKPVLTSRSVEEPSVRIVEDCLASGDSVMGVLAALYQKTRLNDLKSVRVDVAVATAQGILLLRKFASDNGIKLELKVGFMAFGLSRGMKTPGKGLEHSNYITYPSKLLDEIDDLFGGDLGNVIEARVGIKTSEGRKHGSSVQVVGDMGDGGKKPGKIYPGSAPWYDDVPPARYREGTYPTYIYLANGGYFVRGLVHHFNKDVIGNASEVIFSAKRRFDEGDGKNPGLGYGVLLYDIPDEIFP